MQYFLFFDCETTVLPPKGSNNFSNVNIVQIAWSLYTEDKTMLHEKCYIIKPNNYVIPEDFINIHGISDEIAMIKGHDLNAVLNEFISVINQYKPILIGHNVDFYRDLVLDKLKISTINSNYWGKLFTICIMKESTEYCALQPYYRGNYKWPKLRELYKILFNKEMINAHDALFDVRAIIECFYALIDVGVISREHFQRVIPMSESAISNYIIPTVSTPPVIIKKEYQPQQFNNIVKVDSGNQQNPLSQVKITVIHNVIKNDIKKKSNNKLLVVLGIIIIGIIALLIKKNPPLSSESIIQLQDSISTNLSSNYSALSQAKYNTFAEGFRNGKLILHKNNYFQNIDLNSNEAILSLAFSPNSDLLAVGMRNGEIKIYKNGNLLYSENSQKEIITDLYFINDSKLISFNYINIYNEWEITSNGIYSTNTFKLNHLSKITAIKDIGSDQSLLLGMESGELLLVDSRMKIKCQIQISNTAIRSIELINPSTIFVANTNSPILNIIKYPELSKDTIFNFKSEILEINKDRNDIISIMTSENIYKTIYNHLNRE